MESLNYPWMMYPSNNNSLCRTEKWVKHYSSSHRILLVGDGDFSFSLSLALGFGSAFNIFATSLDSYETLTEKYDRASSNLARLQQLGATLLHKVDATEMKDHPQLKMHKFDRIVFNFPHAGFYRKEDNSEMIKLHQNLVRGFFRNARCLLGEYGQIHVSHKTKPPYSHWNITQLAQKNLLHLIECIPFDIRDYPYYQNKRGEGSTSDDPFHLGDCCTFKFTMLPRPTEKYNTSSSHFKSRVGPSYNHPLHIEPQTFKNAAFSPKGIQGSTQNLIHRDLSWMETVNFTVKGEVRHYPARAGYAGVLVDEKHGVRAMFYGPLSCMNLDVADLLAIKFALLMFERSSLCRRAMLVVESNSKNAVSWIKSCIGNPWELEADIEEIKMALGRIQNVEIRCTQRDYGANQTHFVDTLAVKGLNMDKLFEAWL